MTVWEVSEPYINLWLYDEPVGYQPSIGGRMSFKLAYKQRETIVPSSSFFSAGPMWDCSWLTYIVDDYYGYSATMIVPGGGQRSYICDNSSKEYFSHTVLQRTDNGTTVTNFTVTYANGAKDVYDYISPHQISMHDVAFLTAKIDAFGHTTRFVYQETNSATVLRYIIDTDGRTNTLTYANATYPSQITGVQDPFGRSATLKYNSNGMLTNITDTIGITSSFKYDSQGWVTNLTTPYGTTVFEHTTSPVELFDGGSNPYEYTPSDNTLVRAVKVIDAENGTNIYMLRENSAIVFTNRADFTNASTCQSDFDAGNFDRLFIESGGDYSCSAYDASLFPTAPGDYPWAIRNECLNYRDSFHWGPLQAAGLPVDITIFPASSFLKARMRHWAHGASDVGGYGVSPVPFMHISQTLEMEQEPSPDGTTKGQTTWFGYDGSSDIIEGYDSQPSLVARVIPDGTTQYTWFQRDDWGRPTNVIETFSSAYGATPLTRTNSYIYDANEVNLVKHISPLNETTTYGYNANNLLLRMTNAVNEITSYTYDSNGRLTSITTPSGLVTTNIYFSSGLYTNYIQTTIDLGINRTNSFTYTSDLVYSHIDERGLATTNTWDNLNRLIKTIYPDGTFVTNSYKWLDLVRVLDRMGFTNSYGYDGIRHRIAVTNALGNYTHYNYCPCGALESVEDADGNFTSFSYDNAGRLTQTGYPDDTYTLNYSYDLLGRVTNTVDSGGTSTTNWYNNQGLVYAVSNNVGQVSSRAFDADDRVTNNIDADNVSVATTYDPLGRVLTRTYPDSGVEKYGYTLGYSGPTSYTNQITNIVLYAYDVANRKTNEVYMGVTTNQFDYNAASDLLTLKDGKSQTTTWGYDSFGRVTNKLDAASNLLFVYKYDPDNRLTNRWSATKGGTSYNYDAAGNLTKVDYPVSPDITLGYDKLNRLTNMVDAVGTTVYGYDAIGQLLNEDGPWSSDALSYSYANRLRTGLSVQSASASAWAQSYGYDAGRRLKSVVSPVGEFDYIYNPTRLQRVDELTLPGGAYITNTFDNVARLTGTYLKNSGGTSLDSYAYGYNKAGQRTNVVRTSGDYVNYTYDNMGELKTAIGKEAGGVTNRWQEQFGYAYDAAGNLNYRTNNTLLQQFNVNSLNELTTTTNGGRLTVAGSTTSPATNVTVNTSNAVLYADVAFASTNQPWVYGDNTYTAIAKDVYGRKDTNSLTVNLSGTNSYTYDLNGNLLSDGKRGFDYDDENELIRVTLTNTWKSEFTYDGKMRRRITKDFIWNGSAWTQTNEIHYVYDGNVVVQERDTNNLPLVSYTRGNDLSGSMQGAGGIGGLLGRTDMGRLIGGAGLAHAVYHADGNGNVTCLIYTNQTIAAKYLYDPFGSTLSQYGALADANAYRFSSKEWNNNSGLYYYLYRYYDPNLQRWPNRDPLGELGFEGISQYSWHLPHFRPVEYLEGPNLFEFIINDPITSIDARGMMSIVIRRVVPRLLPKPELGGPYIQASCKLKETVCHDSNGNPSGKVCHYDCETGHFSDQFGFSYSLDLAQSANHPCGDPKDVANAPPPIFYPIH